jgi:hypothetical protein
MAGASAAIRAPRRRNDPSTTSGTRHDWQPAARRSRRFDEPASEHALAVEEDQ